MSSEPYRHRLPLLGAMYTREGAIYHRVMMMLLALAMWLSVPASPPPADDRAQYAKDQITLFAETEKEAGRVLEPLGEHTTPLPSTAPAQPGPYRSVAVFLDRTGGCVNAWVRLTQIIPTLGTAPTRQVERFEGAACSASPLPLNHLLGFLDAVANKRWQWAAQYLPGSLQFPLGREANGKLSRTTWDREQLLAGKVPFPTCDPFADTPSCDATRASGRATCRCQGPLHAIEIDFQIDPERPTTTPQLLSVRERLTAPP